MPMISALILEGSNLDECRKLKTTSDIKMMLNNYIDIVLQAKLLKQSFGLKIKYNCGKCK